MRNFLIVLFSSFFLPTVVLAENGGPSENENDLLTVSISITVDLPCNGSDIGVALALPIGGLPPYSFQWSNGSLLATALNLSAGNYSVTVTDLLGQSAVASVSLAEPPPINIAVTNQVNIDCNNPNGTLAVNASGGVGGFSYIWSNLQLGNTATNLSAGLYTVTCTDLNLCAQTKTIQVNSNLTLPSVSASVGAQLNCNNLSLNLN